MTEATVRPSRRSAIGLIGAAMFWPRPGLANAHEAISGYAFGTDWRILGPSGAGLERLRTGIKSLFETVDRQMSPWRSDSSVSRINAGSAGWHTAEDDLLNVTQSALMLAQDSSGTFDPTVGPLVARWGFGPIEGGSQPDWRGLSVGPRGIAKSRGDLTLDLCGIAKGWALDRAADLAAAAGQDSLLIDLGGELKALGHHPAGRAWQIAVQHPLGGGSAVAALRLRAGLAVATSGLRSQSYTLGDRTYGHIINPLARVPADAGLGSVTVVEEDAMTADGWATALFAAGKTAGPELAQARGINSLFLVHEGAEIRQIMTGSIGDMLL